jgi:hypothetical protein
MLDVHRLQLSGTTFQQNRPGVAFMPHFGLERAHETPPDSLLKTLTPHEQLALEAIRELTERRSNSKKRVTGLDVYDRLHHLYKPMFPQPQVLMGVLGTLAESGRIALHKGHSSHFSDLMSLVKDITGKPLDYLFGWQPIHRDVLGSMPILWLNTMRKNDKTKELLSDLRELSATLLLNHV